MSVEPWKCRLRVWLLDVKNDGALCLVVVDSITASSFSGNVYDSKYNQAAWDHKGQIESLGVLLTIVDMVIVMVSADAVLFASLVSVFKKLHGARSEKIMRCAMTMRCAARTRKQHKFSRTCIRQTLMKPRAMMH